MTFTTETPLDFDFTYTPGEAPTRDYPGSGAEVEIVKVRLNGVEIPLKAISAEVQEQMIEQVLEHYYWIPPCVTQGIYSGPLIPLSTVNL